MQKPLTVPALLRSAADLFEQRHKQYGNNYKQFANAHYAIFGKDMSNIDGLAAQVTYKLTRYQNGGDPFECLIDAIVYLAMMIELHEEQDNVPVRQPETPSTSSASSAGGPTQPAAQASLFPGT